MLAPLANMSDWFVVVMTLNQHFYAGLPYDQLVIQATHRPYPYLVKEVSTAEPLL